MHKTILTIKKLHSHGEVVVMKTLKSTIKICKETSEEDHLSRGKQINQTLLATAGNYHTLSSSEVYIQNTIKFTLSRFKRKYLQC